MRQRNMDYVLENSAAAKPLYKYKTRLKMVLEIDIKELEEVGHKKEKIMLEFSKINGVSHVSRCANDADAVDIVLRIDANVVEVQENINDKYIELWKKN